MAFYDTLAFGAFDPVTRQPRVDGAVMADEGVPDTFTPPEPGYVGGARYVFQGGALPPVAIQTVRDGDTLVIGIFCRGDFSFDTDFDACVLAFRESFANPGSAARRVDIFPVYGDEGTPVDPNGIGRGADDKPPAGSPAGPVPDVRTDKLPRAVTWYRPSSGSNPWTPFTPPGSSRFEAKVRSWQPPVAAGTPQETAWSIEVRVPISRAAGGADWIDLQNEFGIYVNVIRGGRLPRSGVDADYYCTQFRFPHFSAAGAVSPSLPDTRLTGELDASTSIPAAWYGKGLLNPTAAQVQGVRFQPGIAAIGRRPRNDPSPVPTGLIARNEDNDLVALLHNSGPSVSGVTAEFRLANWGLESSLGAWARPPGLQNPSGPISMPAGTNGSPSSGTTVNRWDAAQVPGDYDPPNHHQCVWVQLMGTANFTEAARRRNMDFRNLSALVEEAEISGEGYPPPADGQPAHDFLLFTRCREIIVSEMVKYRETIDAETLALLESALAGVDRGANTTRATASYAADIANPANRENWWVDYKVLLWITEGFRRTGRTLTIGQRTAMILDEDPGAFGFVATHKGVPDPVGWSFAGPGMVQYAPGVTGIKVRPGERIRVKVTLEASPETRAGDRSELPRGELPKPLPEGPNQPRPDDPSSMKPKWWWVLLGILGLAALRRLLKR